jgi:uncharacterized SAM-binding protein YcdF (DUF218 family)
MGFILKKIISTFLMPLPIGILLFLAALIFLLKKQTGKSRTFLIAGLVWLSVLSYDPVANLLLYQIESSYPALHHAPPKTRYIYVLGCGHSSDETLPITSQLDKEAVIRLNEGIRLYRQLNGKAKLILSGYSGLSDPTPHALMQERLATALGVNAKDIILKPEPKDTEEEAVAAKQIARNQPLVLVTSASHMPRAMHWFNKAGLHPIPAPTAHQASIKHPNYFGIFSVGALKKSTTVFHELLGSLWQNIKGD